MSAPPEQPEPQFNRPHSSRASYAVKIKGASGPAQKSPLIPAEKEPDDEQPEPQFSTPTAISSGKRPEPAAEPPLSSGTHVNEMSHVMPPREPTIPSTSKDINLTIEGTNSSLLKKEPSFSRSNSNSSSKDTSSFQPEPSFGGRSGSALQKEPTFSKRGGSGLQKEPTFSNRGGSGLQKEPTFSNRGGSGLQKEPTFSNKAKSVNNEPDFGGQNILGVQKMSLVHKEPSFSQHKKTNQSQPFGSSEGDDEQAEPTISKPPVSFGGVQKPAPQPGDYIRKLNQYKLKKELGKGSFGKVYEAINETDNATYAIKELNKAKLLKQAATKNVWEKRDTAGPGRGRGRGGMGMMGRRGEPKKETTSVNTDTTKMTEEEKMAFCREVAVLKKIMHPFCCRLYEVLDDPNDDNFYMVMDLCRFGPVINLKQGEVTTPMNIEKAVNFFKQMTYAVHYLHANNIAHRDIKPDNILIRDKDNIQLVDFGVACMFDSELKGATAALSEGTTIAFQPPETWPNLFEDDEEGNDSSMSEEPGKPEQSPKKPSEADGLSDAVKAKAADCWALGCTLYAMVFGILPFEAPEGGIAAVIEVIKKKELIWDVEKLNISTEEDKKVNLDHVRQVLMDGLLVRKPIMSRYTAEQVLKSSLYNEPSDKITANKTKIVVPSEAEIKGAITNVSGVMATVTAAIKFKKSLKTKSVPSLMQGKATGSKPSK